MAGKKPYRQNVKRIFGSAIEPLEQRVLLSFSAGARVYTVGVTASRSSYSTTAQDYQDIASGQYGTIREGPQYNQGFEWYRVDWDNYSLPMSDGWSASGSPRFVGLSPSISNVSPTSMPASNSDQTLTINGANFVSGATLTFDPPTGSNITSNSAKLTFVSSSKITYQINNASDVGTWTVKVNNPDGQSSGTASFTVTAVAAAPSISNVSPTSMPASNSDQTLTINGANFVSGATLTFDPPTGSNITSNSAKLTFVSSSKITYQINNASDVGTWTVKVNNPDGQSSGTASFTVTAVAAAPSISNVSPTSMPASNSDQTLTINGANFVSGATLTFDPPTGSNITSNSAKLTFVSSSKITYQINNASDVGTWTVKVNNPDGQSSGTASFTVDAPNIPVSDGFDYPIGNKGRYTEANDGDGWYVATEFNEIGANGKYHLGEDWNAETGGSTDLGSPVYAIAKGTIIFAGEATHSGWGKVIIVRHLLADGSQVESLYGHVQTILRSSGNVSRGEQIATLGDGDGIYLGAAHLHLELRTSNCPDWGSEGVGYSSSPSPIGWTDPSNFIDSHRPTSVSAPSISSVSPTSMPASNSDQTLTINGANFVSGATLTFDPPTGSNITSNSAKLTFVSSSKITYQINNASDVGTWTVKVNNPDGQSSGTASFTVTAVAAAPSISNVSPTSMPASNSDQTLTINGANFVSGATLTFDPPTGSNITSNSAKLTFVSSSKITYQINNASDVGTWTVKVNNPDGQSSGTASFTVTAVAAAPSISNVSPTSMPASNSDQTLTINGANFVSGATLTFDPPTGSNITSNSAKLTFVSSSKITYQINNASDVGTWTVKVNNPDGQSSGTASFTVTAVAAAPSISNVSPTSMPASNSDQTLTINGANFVSGATLTFDPPTGSNITSNSAKLTFVSSSKITYQINNASDVGTWTVKVNNPDGQSSGTASFTVTAVAAAPSISNVSPTSMPASNSDQTLTINGANFVSGATLTFDPPTGSNITSNSAKLTFVSSSKITYQINNAGDVGTWTVKVTNPDGQSSGTASFAVTSGTNPPPTIQSGIDYRVGTGSATTGVSVTAIKSAGKSFVGEYIGVTDNNGYLRPSDVTSLTGEGLTIVTLFERTPTSTSYFTLANADFDAADAISAAAKAGQPSGSAIYFTIDYPASDAGAASAIDAYFREIRTDFNSYFAAHPGVQYDIGIYGPGNVLPQLMADAQIGAKSSWVAKPFGYSYASADLAQTQDTVLIQGVGINVDLDEAYTANFGQWSGTSAVETPHLGSPFVINNSTTTMIQAEDFDNGGEGVAYHDTESANLGGKYRPTEGVDIESTTDTGGGYDVGWTKAGEYLKYSINVANTGSYDFAFDVAAASSNGTFHVEIDDANVTGTLAMPNTGGWQVWKTVSMSGVHLDAGNHILKLVMYANGSSGFVGNFNYIAIKPSAVQPPPGHTPFGGTPFEIASSGTSTLQAENFDNGGEGVAYHDADAANLGGKYRTGEGVDIETVANDTGSYDVGWVKAGEWLGYTVHVDATGTYDLNFAVAAASSNGEFHVELDGNDISGPLTIPNTGGWQNWQKLPKNGVQLTQGDHFLKLMMDTNGSSGYVGNFNYITIAPSGGQPQPSNFTVQAEDFDSGGEGVAYHDTESANLGGKYRPNEGVDIESTTDTGGGYDVGWTKAGEWIDYTVNVPASGAYDITFRVAAASSNGKFHAEIGGVNVTGSLTVPNTGGWQNWQPLTVHGIQMSADQRTLKLVMESNGSSGYVGNFNWIGFAPKSQAETNLALNRPAVSSSNENASLGAGNVADGNASTRWSSAWSDPQWVYVDLGSTHSIDRVVLNWESAYAKAFQIQVSNDAQAWNPIYSTSSGTGGVQNLTGLSGTGRYVRMYGTQRATIWGYSLFEMEVYGA